MSGYIYQDPCEMGYIRIPVSRNKHGELFPFLEKRFGQRVDYYYHPEWKALYIEYTTHWWAKVLLITAMVIPSIILQGVPETFKDIGDSIYEKKRGKFTTDRFWLKTDQPHEDLKEFLKAKLGDKYDLD